MRALSYGQRPVKEGGNMFPNRSVRRLAARLTLAVALVVGLAHAQLVPKTITATIVGPNTCPNNSFTVLSFSQSAGSGVVTVIKAFDACSPGLFRAMAAGTRLTSLTITEQDSSSQNPLRIVLNNPAVTAYKLQDQTGNSPVESVDFDSRSG